MSVENEVGVEGINGVLAAGISPTDSSFTLDSTVDAGEFPTSSFQVKIGNEIILVGSRSGASFSSLTRGQERTLAVPHARGDGVELIVGGEVISSGGRGGGSLPVNWVQVGVAMASPAPLTFDNSFYEFVGADFTIQAQSGSDFSIGPDNESFGGTLLSAGGGRFQAALSVGSITEGTLDGSSTALRWVGFGFNVGAPDDSNIYHGPGAAGLDDTIPVIVGVGIDPWSCKASTIGYTAPGGIALTGAFVSLNNPVGSDSITAPGMTLYVWQV